MKIIKLTAKEVTRLQSLVTYKIDKEGDEMELVERDFNPSVQNYTMGEKRKLLVEYETKLRLLEGIRKKLN